MALFQTGAITSMPAFLNTLATFCVTNGWTQNYNNVEGSGRRVHLQLGSDVFINLRVLVNERSTTGVGNFVNGLAVIGSTGYNGALDWEKQPGSLYFTSGSNVYKAVGIMGAAGAMPAYYIFARSNMVYVWIEYTTGLYQWLVFGKLEKYSSFTGGMFYSGSSRALDGTILYSPGFANNQQGGNGTGVNMNGALYATIGSDTGWLVADNDDGYPAMPKIFDTIGLEGNNLANAANTFNNQAVLLPVEMCITRDGHTNHIGTTNFGIEAFFPDLYLCNLRYLIPGQQLPDGSGNNYRVLPFYQKTNLNFWGVAIKEN